MVERALVPKRASQLGTVAATLLVVAAGVVTLLFLAGASPEVATVPFYGLELVLVYNAGLLTSALALVLATALALAGGSRAYSRSLALCLATLSFGSLLILAITVPYGDGESALHTLLFRSWWLIPTALVVGTGAFLRFAALFPRPLTPAEIRHVSVIEADDSVGRADRLIERLPPALRRAARFEVVVDGGRLVTEPRRLWTAVILLAGGPLAVLFLLDGLPGWLGIAVSPGDPATWVGVLAVFVLFVSIPVGLVFGAALLRLGYSLADEADRRRMRWIIESLNAFVWGAAALVAFVVLDAVGIRNPVVDWAPVVLTALLPLIVMSGLAVAVFYDGALEPSLVVRKNTLLGLFGFGLAFAFAMVEELVTEHLTARLGLPDGTGTLVASGAVAAVVGGFYGRFRAMATGYITSDKSDEREPT